MSGFLFVLNFSADVYNYLTACMIKHIDQGVHTMKNPIVVGMSLGVVAGVLDVIPMWLQGLTWDANLSAFFMWVVSGFMMATSNLRLAPVLKGILIPFICLLPSAFIIGWKEPFSLIPIGIMTLVLGAMLGFVYSKVVKAGQHSPAAQDL